MHKFTLHYSLTQRKYHYTGLRELKKRKERKKKKKEALLIDINNKLVQLLFYQLKEGFPFVVMDLKFIE